MSEYRDNTVTSPEEYQLTEQDREILKGFSQLTIEERAKFIELMKSLLKNKAK